jgi:putative phage-type endonuclease
MKTDDEGVIQLIRLAESYSDVSGVVTEKLPAPPEREEWLRQRKRGIGGSDAAAILGLDPYRTIHDVYADKLSDSIEQTDNPHMKRGRKLERMIVSEYSETHPEDMILPGTPTSHPQYPWMLGTPDGYIVSPHVRGKGVVEVKCPAKYAFEKIKLEGVPANYVIQMQHYLAITGLTWGRFIIFNADSWEMLVVDVEAFNGVEQDKYMEVLREFWEHHVIPQVPPAKPENERVILPKVSGLIKERDDAEFAQAVEAYVQAQQYEKEAKSLVDSTKEAVLDAINRENGVYESDDYRVYYTPVDGRVTFDRKALAASRPIDGAKLMGVLSDMGHGDLVPKLAERANDFIVDLSRFETRGNDFSTLRTYPRKKS